MMTTTMMIQKVLYQVEVEKVRKVETLIQKVPPTFDDDDGDPMLTTTTTTATQ